MLRGGEVRATVIPTRRKYIVQAEPSQWFLGKSTSARCAVPLVSPGSRQIVGQEALP
jgi:hypothetical protein